MGRHSGFIAMYSGLAGGAEEILVPESPTIVNNLVAELRKAHDRGKTSMIVVVAEGDDAGNAYTIAKKVQELAPEFDKARVAVIGHMQRGGTPSAFDRILAARMGVAGVEALLDGKSDVMVAFMDNTIALRPLSDSWESRNRFDPDLFRVARLLSV